MASLPGIAHALHASATACALTSAIAFAAAGAWLGWRESRLRASATTDPLTGVGNRRFLQERFAARASHRAAPIALLVADVDRLKAINDTQGHDRGDEALRLVAQALRSACRATDSVVRWGGDEFVVLAPGLGPDEAEGLAARVRAALSQRALTHGLPVTVSIGVAGRQPAGPLLLERLISDADHAMYAAKAATGS